MHPGGNGLAVKRLQIQLTTELVAALDQLQEPRQVAIERILWESDEIQAAAKKARVKRAARPRRGPVPKWTGELK